MQKHLNQAKHNETFHDAICDKFGSDYFDWKITSVFYCAIHYLKALASKRGIELGDSHFEIEKCINPHSKSATMKITNTAFTNYKALYQYSRVARYDGFTDKSIFDKLREGDYKHCVDAFDKFKLYIKGQGIPVD